jgi:hypothetical protein
MRTDGQTDRHDKTKCRLSQFCELAEKQKVWSKLKLQKGQSGNGIHSPYSSMNIDIPEEFTRFRQKKLLYIKYNKKKDGYIQKLAIYHLLSERKTEWIKCIKFVLWKTENVDKADRKLLCFLSFFASSYPLSMKRSNKLTGFQRIQKVLRLLPIPQQKYWSHSYQSIGRHSISLSGMIGFRNL